MPTSHSRLIVLDFGGIDGNARLNEVLPKESWDGEISVIDPLTEPWPADRADSLGRWAAAQAVALGSAPVFAVMGHCSNAAVATELCRALTTRATDVGRLILFAPVKVDRTFVADQAVRLLTALGASPQEAQVGVAQDFAAATPLAQVLATVFGRIGQRTRSQAHHLGLDPEEAEVFAEELDDRYQRWLGFLASLVDHRALDPGAAIEIISEEPAEAVQRATAEVEGLRIRGHHCADPFGFANPAVQHQVRELLTASDIPAVTP